MLVAGFPCQPFSALGSQPAFEDDRGLLFREIVRVLKASRAKTFLLENVPGLLLVGGDERNMTFIFLEIFGMSSSQLTNSYFSEGFKPPTRLECDDGKAIRQIKQDDEKVAK